MSYTFASNKNTFTIYLASNVVIGFLSDVITIVWEFFRKAQFLRVYFLGNMI